MQALPGQSHRKPRHPRGASATEYLLVLTLVVIPLGLFFLVYGIHTIVVYWHRMGWVIRTPFG